MMNMPLLVGAIGLALTGLFGYHYIYHGQQEQLRQIRSEITEVQAQTEVAELLKQVERYRRRLPPAQDPEWLIREVVALSEQAGVQLTTISQENPRTADQFTRLAITIQFNASYHQLGAFLDRIEHAGHFMQVERVDVTTASSRGELPAIHMVLSTFYLPPIQ